MPRAEVQKFSFGTFDIPSTDVFATTRLSYAFVNLKPAVPGHVLVSPQRVVGRFQELSPEEVTDLWLLAQRVSACISDHYSADAMNIAIQDGPAAGQTVPHVHIHCLPRHQGDLENNDDIYDMMNKSEAEGEAARRHVFDLEKERVCRTPEEMEQEAMLLSNAMEQFSLGERSPDELPIA